MDELKKQHMAQDADRRNQVELLCDMVKDCTDASGEVDEAKLIGAIVEEYHWSREAAEQVITVAKDYGSLFLADAFSLSIAMDIPDGELGY